MRVVSSLALSRLVFSENVLKQKRRQEKWLTGKGQDVFQPL